MKDTNKIDLKKAGKDFAKRFTGVMSRLADEDTNTLREEWLTSYSSFKNVDKMSDWIINKFNQKLEEIEREIEFKRKKGEFIKVEKELKRLKLNASEQDFNEGLDLALQIIKNKKN